MFNNKSDQANKCIIKIDLEQEKQDYLKKEPRNSEDSVDSDEFDKRFQLNLFDTNPIKVESSDESIKNDCSEDSSDPLKVSVKHPPKLENINAVKSRNKEESLIGKGVDVPESAKKVNRGIESGSNKNELVCPKCGDPKFNEALLQLHLQVHDGFAETQCKICSKTFASPTDVLEHCATFNKHTHKDDDHYKALRPFPCTECDKRFAHRRNLTEHLLTHSDKKEHLCELCEKAFPRFKSLKQHLRWHTTVLDKTVAKSCETEKLKITVSSISMMCELCGKKFKNATKLRVHVNRHKNIKEYKCKVCPKAFVTDTDRQRHMISHTGEKPHSCKFCEKKYADLGSKIKHERLHTGERPYECETCHKMFTNSTGLNIHQRAAHTGKKEFNCNFCATGFAKKKAYENHIKTHNDSDHLEILAPNMNLEDDIQLSLILKSNFATL